MKVDASSSLSPSLNVISSVSLVLRDVIVRSLGCEFGLTPLSIDFSQPCDSASRGTGVSLFAYHLQPARSFTRWPVRACEHDTAALTAAPASAHEDRAAMPLELCYMVAPYAHDASAEPRLLASLAGLFHALKVVDVATLPESCASRDLLASGNARLRLVAQYPDMNVIDGLGATLCGDAIIKRALYYTVTPVMLPFRGSDSPYRVQEIVAETLRKIS
jgi:hypothetical protein